MQVELWFKSTAGELTITDLSRRTGAAPSALRFYERRGLLRPQGRRGGKRVYTADSVEQVALIDLLKLAGFTLTEVAGLVDTEGRVSSGWREQAGDKLAELSDRLDKARRAQVILEHTVACPHELLHECPTHRRIVRSHAASLCRRAGTSTPGKARSERPAAT